MRDPRHPGQSPAFPLRTSSRGLRGPHRESTLGVAYPRVNAVLSTPVDNPGDRLGNRGKGLWKRLGYPWTAAVDFHRASIRTGR